MPTWTRKRIARGPVNPAKTAAWLGLGVLVFGGVYAAMRGATRGR